MKFMLYLKQKNQTSFIVTCGMLQPFVLMQSHLLLYWHGFYDVSVTLCEVIITLSKYTRVIHLRSDSTELDEAVPIEVKFWHEPSFNATLFL